MCFLDCGARRKFLHINPCWASSALDSKVFKMSQLYKDFEGGKHNGILLGNSAYALRDYMLTPFLLPETKAEIRQVCQFVCLFIHIDRESF